MRIGIYETHAGPFNGWMDEVRISKGVARWTSNFTPPTEEYASDSSTKFLHHFNGLVKNGDGSIFRRTKVTEALLPVPRCEI